MFPTEIKELPAVQLFVLMLSFFVLLLVSAGVSVGLGSMGISDERTVLLTASAVQCVVAFCLPAWITARFSSSHPANWLYLTKKLNIWCFAGVVVGYIIVMPALNWVVDWNEHIHFPESMHKVEETFRSWENANGGIANKILEGASPTATAAAVCIVGLLTGFSEELFFRGALQGIIHRSRVSNAVAVWGAAAIFSALHFQFFGFVPRLLMGAFFGYLLVWSRSLWLPIFAHAFNNSMVVLSYNTERMKGDLENIGLTDGGGISWIAIGSAFLFALYLYAFRNYLLRKEGGIGNG